ncbi:transposable element Tcb2 transposase [Trichonephila clavipes]|nr:transposable element Tcb2 transposase [Trichonephila clavipes]
MPIGHLYKRKNRWNAEILSITNRSVSNSECGPVCDLKTVAEVSKNGRCYPTTSIRSTTRVTTPLQDRYLVISAQRQRGSTARALGSALTVTTGIRISRLTVYRRLNHAGLNARRPEVCIPLTSAHKRDRLNWSLKYQHWSVGEWANVKFCDESRFNLSSDSRRVTIWRERGTRFEHKKHYGKISFFFKGSNGMVRHHDGRPHRPPFLYTGSVTGQRYRDEVHKPYVRLF